MCPDKAVYFLFCISCDELVEENSVCECGVTTKKNSKKNNYLIFFPLIPQLRRILKHNFSAIMEFLHRKHEVNTLTDIDDGQLFKKLRSANKLHDELLALTMNYDGATIFNSSQGSMWPVQFYLNFLPPALRYLSENVVVSTVYYGAKKPDLNKLLFPVAKELEENDHTIFVHTTDDEIINFGIYVLLIAVDLPARAAGQNFVGHTGKFGCPFCLQEGVSILNRSGKSTTVRYIMKPEMKLRTHTETVQTSINCKGKSINGIKGTSPLLMFKNIDIIHSFTIDIMHAIFLGITKDLAEIWLGKRKLPPPPCEQFKLKPKQIEVLEKRILSLKPPSSMHRKPRSILQISNFKASELLSLLWFYLRYSLTGLLPTKIIKHFELLSAASYTLSKDIITFEEVKSACTLLTNFAKDFENIYGKGAVTMNIHMLLHYFDMTMNCGPLCAHGLFGFESRIGDLKDLVCGTGDILEQIAKKYPLSRITKSQTDTSTMVKIKDSIEMDIGEELTAILLNAGVDVPTKVYRRFIRNGEAFTSAVYQQKKSCDYFVKLANGQIGIVQFYFCLKDDDSFVLKIYDQSFVNHHWTEVTPTSKYEVHSCSEIIEKIMYFEAFGANFVTRMPNRYSRSYC